MRKHLIIACYDGISTFYCGPGTTIQDTLASLEDIIKSKEIKVSLAFIATDPKSLIFNKERFKKSIQITKQTGGHLIPLCNGTPGATEYDMWQSFPQWHYLCASLATSLNILLKDDEDNILMLNDTPFLLFHKFKPQIFNNGNNLRCFYMPRSSGLNHEFGNSAWRKERIALEKEAFNVINKDPKSKVLAIGKNFGKHLTKNYNINFSKKDYFLNGLYFGRYKEYLDKKFNNSQLKRFGINIDSESKIIFSWGRASIAKGLKELLEAWKKANKSLPDYHLIIQAPNNSGEDSYFNHLKKYEQEIPRTIVIDDFNPEIWQTILRTKNTKVVCIPSIMDPNPHTAVEAKLFLNGMDYIIVCSDLDGVKDTFNKNECLWVNPYNKKRFAKKIIEAALLDKQTKNRMSLINKKTLNTYNYHKTIKDFLKRNKFI